MSISNETREIVRKRANFACEFCGVTEINTGGLLTMDHFHPKSKGGSDELLNLVYCCARCNNYKFNYFPVSSDMPSLWNPRVEPSATHFLLLNNGQLQHLTEKGRFTIVRLRLNRMALVKYRLHRLYEEQQQRAIAQYADLLNMQQRLNQQLSTIVKEQNTLLKVHQQLLKILIESK